jgi:hypothetical protein
MKNKLYLIIPLILFLSCSETVNLLDQPREDLTFTQLPLQVRSEMLKMMEPRILIDKIGDTMRVYGESSGFICLDGLKNYKYKEDRHGTFLEGFVFELEGKVFKISADALPFYEPCVLYNKQLYYRKTSSPRTLDDIENGEYGKFDLSNKW